MTARLKQWVGPGITAILGIALRFGGYTNVVPSIVLLGVAAAWGYYVVLSDPRLSGLSASRRQWMLGGGVGAIATATVLIVVFQLKGTPAPERMPLPGRGEPTTSCDDVLDMTPEAIWAELGSHPVAERNSAAVKYEDNCIAWTLPLVGVFPVVPKDARGEEGIAEVYLNGGGSTFMLVTTRVNLAEHPELKGLEEKTQIALRGRITRIVMGRITLHDVKFAVPSEPGSGPPTPRGGR